MKKRPEKGPEILFMTENGSTKTLCEFGFFLNNNEFFGTFQGTQRCYTVTAFSLKKNKRISGLELTILAV
jgi:hypothetical protein